MKNTILIFAILLFCGVNHIIAEEQYWPPVPANEPVAEGPIAPQVLPEEDFSNVPVMQLPLNVASPPVSQPDYTTANGDYSQDNNSSIVNAVGTPEAEERIVKVSNETSDNPFPWLKVTQGTTKLPKDGGQLWMEYDISPYTKPRRINGAKPEEAIIDWVLRATETEGKSVWHVGPFAILSADENMLYVYHTPEVQQKVAETVSRFVNPKTEFETYSIRVVSLGNTNWRNKAQTALQPISTDSPGVQAWLINREDSLRIQSDISRKSDFREHCPNTAFYNGQSLAGSSKNNRSFSKFLRVDPNTSTYTTFPENVQEGYDFSILALMDSNNASAFLRFKCKVSQLEKTHPVVVDIPATQSVGRSRVTLETPQMAGVDIDEFLRWPKDKVLLLDLGMVPMPQSILKKDTGLLSSLSKITGEAGTRANVLVFIEPRGALDPNAKSGQVAPVTNIGAQTPITPVVQPESTGTVPPPAPAATSDQNASQTLPFLGSNKTNSGAPVAPGKENNNGGRWKRF